MRKIIHKLFWAWDFDKEEKWLNEMSAIGLQLAAVNFGRYDFDEGEPGEYMYRMELLKHSLSHPESEKYIRFLEETGVQNVGYLKNWAYFRKKADSCGFDIYSDFESRIKHLKRVRNLISILMAVELICFMYEFFAMIITGYYMISILAAALLILMILMGCGIFKLQSKIKNLQRDFSLHEH